MEYFKFLYLRTPLQSFAETFKKNKTLNGLFQEGLFLSSKDFWQQSQKIGSPNSKSDMKIRETLEKYWIRSCSRCTPFGTFAGSALVLTDQETTNLTLNDQQSFHRSTRLDMNFLYSIIRLIEKNPIIEKQVRLFKNSSIYETSQFYRYSGYIVINNQRKYQLISVEKEEYLDILLRSADSGLNIIELTQILVELTGASFDDAYNYIQQLWDSQLLVSELEPCVTGPNPLNTLINKLNSIDKNPIEIEKLTSIYQMLENSSGIECYIKIEKELEKLFRVPVPKNTIQVDLFLSLKTNKIKKSVLESVFGHINDLSVFNRPYRSSALENFKKKFLEKFEEREVPLNIALDAELGVGYTGLSNDSIASTEWIDDIDTYTPSNIINGGLIELDHLQQFSLNKYIKYLKQDGHKSKGIIEIDDDEISNFKNNNITKFPYSMYLMGTFLKHNNNFDENNYLFDFHGIGGPSGGNLLGRFISGDKELEKFTKEILKDEEDYNPGVIYAEIAHIPEERIGNILLRPLLRNYEIPYLGKSGANKENQILIEDLFVRVVDNEVIITSRRLSKRVIPRLTSAHNFNSPTSLPIYRFLCDLQSQSFYFPTIWDWGVLVNQRYLPRIVYKNIIIKKARWLVTISDLKNPKTKKFYLNEELISVLGKKGIPRDFILNQGDNKLLINLNNNNSVDILINYIKKYRQIEIEEFLFDKNNSIVQDIDGNPFMNEVIIPFKNTKSFLLKQRNFNINHKKLDTRAFPPGSEWLYFKIYCGSKIAENLLIDPIYNFIEKSLSTKSFQQFFFIRYKDPEPHIRIRFYNSNPKKNNKVQENFIKVLNPFLKDELIHSIVLDTYKPEVERYEFELVRTAEQLFFNDSLAVIRIIKLLDGHETEHSRLLLALRGIDQLLDDFNYDLANKLMLFKQLSESMFNRFGGHTTLKNIINAKYKRFQKIIFKYMNRDINLESEFEDALSIFDTRSRMNLDIIQSFYLESEASDIKMKFDRQLANYIHMFVNRFFIAQQLKYELIIYIFLERYYSSMIYIHRKATQN